MSGQGVNLFAWDQAPETGSAGQPQQHPAFHTTTTVSTSSSMDPSLSGGVVSSYVSGDDADELPLLEELDIDLQHIKSKSFTVLNPFRAVDSTIVKDCDLAGPFVVVLMLAGTLTMVGKLHFGVIYGLCTSGGILTHLLMHLMCEQSMPATFTWSVLGYCLIPVLLLSGLSTALSVFNVPLALKVMSPAFVFWSGWCATKLFVAAFETHHQRFLILYPLLLLYSTFVYIVLY
eukprot:PhM_4_TR7064/c0_g1_i1/m.13445/K20363/YIP1, YIPF5; protein transport protein YIP1